jgi:hypothetical protein
MIISYWKKRLLTISFAAIALCSHAWAQQALANIAGNWTIYSNRIGRPGSDLKTMQISQDGSISSGRFKGPRQSGKIQGLVTGNHVEISTDTWVVLTFRGRAEGNTMSGLFGIRGRHAAWYAQRTN